MGRYSSKTMSSRETAPGATGAPTRNFTLSSEARVRAAVSGPLAYMKRLRVIEDLEKAIVDRLSECCKKAATLGIEPRSFARAAAPTGALARLDDLVDRHNRWYPVEANLPIDPRTGQLLDRDGTPWQPIQRGSLDKLLAFALSRLPSGP
jgi:hypothetical protein